MRNITIIIFIIIITVINITPVFAAEQDLVGYSKIHPASPLFFLKTIRENLELKLAFTKRVRMLRQLEFAFRRLKETKTLIGQNEDLIPPTLERYNSHLGTLPDRGLEDNQVIKAIEDNLVIHLKVLRQIYDQASSLRAKMFIRSTMNKIVLRADVSNLAKAPICDFFTKEASSSALNQTEQFVLAERARICLQSIRSITFK